MYLARLWSKLIRKPDSLTPPQATVAQASTPPRTSIKPIGPIKPTTISRYITPEIQTLSPDYLRDRTNMWHYFDDYRLWDMNYTWEGFIKDLELHNDRLRGEITGLRAQLADLQAKRRFKP